MRGSILENIVYGVENYTQEQVDEAVRIANLGFL
jgi:ABC-type multidrug transport system fused ATPase/permease subunit